MIEKPENYGHRRTFYKMIDAVNEQAGLIKDLSDNEDTTDEQIKSLQRVRDLMQQEIHNSHSRLNKQNERIAKLEADKQPAEYTDSGCQAECSACGERIDSDKGRVKVITFQHPKCAGFGYEPKQPAEHEEGHWECDACGRNWGDGADIGLDGAGPSSKNWKKNFICCKPEGGCGEKAVRWIPAKQEPADDILKEHAHRVEPKAQEVSKTPFSDRIASGGMTSLESWALNEVDRLWKENAELKTELKLYFDTYVPPGTTPYFEEPKAREGKCSFATALSPDWVCGLVKQLRKENDELGAKLKDFDEADGAETLKNLEEKNAELTKRLEYHIGTPQYQDLLADNERLNIELAGETERHENDWNQIRQLTEQIEAYRKYADYKEMWLDSETHNRQLREENAKLEAELKLYKDTYVEPGATPYEEPKAQDVSHLDGDELCVISEIEIEQLREENAELQAKLKRYEEVAKRVREYSQLDKADRVWLFAPLADNSEEDILTTDKDEK